MSIVYPFMPSASAVVRFFRIHHQIAIAAATSAGTTNHGLRSRRRGACGGGGAGALKTIVIERSSSALNFGAAKEEARLLLAAARGRDARSMSRVDGDSSTRTSVSPSCGSGVVSSRRSVCGAARGQRNARDQVDGERARRHLVAGEADVGRVERGHDARAVDGELRGRRATDCSTPVADGARLVGVEEPVGVRVGGASPRRRRRRSDHRRVRETQLVRSDQIDLHVAIYRRRRELRDVRPRWRARPEECTRLSHFC